MVDLTRRRAVAALCGGGLAALAGCSARGDTPTPSGRPALDPPVKGDPDAAVTLAVYEDFLCPACRAYHVRVYPEVASALVAPGEVRYEHHDFPLSMHEPGASQAANAARAVQDRHGVAAFWRYADRLFARQDDLRASGDVPALCAEIAAAAGFDADAVETAAREETYAATVAADRGRAEDLGLPGTPSFVVNGDPVSLDRGDDPVAVLRTAVEEAA